MDTDVHMHRPVKLSITISQFLVFTAGYRFNRLQSTDLPKSRNNLVRACPFLNCILRRTDSGAGVFVNPKGHQKWCTFLSIITTERILSHVHEGRGTYSPHREGAVQSIARLLLFPLPGLCQSARGHHYTPGAVCRLR